MAMIMARANIINAPIILFSFCYRYCLSTGRVPDYPFLGEFSENGCQYDCGHDIFCDIHQPFFKFVFHSNTKIGKINRVSGSVRQCNDNKSAVRMEIKKEIQHSTLLERCSSILADAESARVKSDEQDNHFPPLTTLDREGAWLRKISKLSSSNLKTEYIRFLVNCNALKTKTPLSVKILLHISRSS